MANLFSNNTPSGYKIVKLGSTDSSNTFPADLTGYPGWENFTRENFLFVPTSSVLSSATIKGTRIYLDSALNFSYTEGQLQWRYMIYVRNVDSWNQIYLSASCYGDLYLIYKG